MEPRFNFGMHGSNILETYYDENLQPVRVPADCVLDLNTIRPFDRRLFKPVENFLAEVDKKGESSFYIQRTFALGDMLMLVPVVRYLRTLGYDPWIRTSDSFKEILDYLGILVELKERPHLGGFGVVLDGVIERDHRDRSLSYFHRVHIYLKALGVEEMPEKVDWSCNLSQLPEVRIEDEPYIVFQDSGSTSVKRLQNAAVEYIRAKLKSAGVKVVSISGTSLVQAGKWDEQRINFERFDPVLCLFNVIAKAKCLISMDSGPLWISHFTQTPVVCIFGPTRPEERLTLHPLYPEGALGVELSKEIECEPCFEHDKQHRKCGDGIDCLKVKPERIYELLKPLVMQFWRS